MKNINRDYLVTVNARTAKITAPKDMKFFITDILTSNIFFQLIFEDSNNALINNYAPVEDASNYTLTLRVVKPNNEPKTIEVELLDQDSSFFIADLTSDFIDIYGIYECELFIDTMINGRYERSTTNSFEYEVKKSIFNNLDDIIDNKYLSIENIATIEYVNSLAVGGVSLEGYATTEQLNTKADKEHTHDEYITQTELDNALVGVGANINLVDFVVGNSISIKRKEHTFMGIYSTAEGYDTEASGNYSHAEGFNTTASGYYSHAEGWNTKVNNHSAHAEGSLSVASGDTSHAEGYNTKTTAYASHAEGYNTIARGKYQHVQGKYNIEDTNTYAHIVGNGNIDIDTGEITRSNAHTLDWEGNAWFAGKITAGSDPTEDMDVTTKKYVDDAVTNNSTNVDLSDYAPKESPVFTGSISLGRTEGSRVGNYSFAVGNNVEASGNYSHAEGNDAIASGMYSHAEGNGTLARGFSAHAEGNGCKVGSSSIFGANYAHAEGQYTLASSISQHVQGRFNIEDTANTYAHIVGNGTSDARSNAHTLDWSGNAWFAGNVTIGADNKELATQEYVDEAISNINTEINIDTNNLVVGNSISMDRKAGSTIGKFSTATGYQVISSGHASHAEGYSTTASSLASHAEGLHNTASGEEGSHAEGYYTTASGNYSHSEGYYTTANSMSSHAEGEHTTASGRSSHAEGYYTTASDFYAHAEGSHTTANGRSSHAEGYYTIANGNESYPQHVQGKYNIEDTANVYAHIVGKGSSPSNRSNAHTLDWNGNGWYAGDLYVGGTSQSDANKVLSTADIKFTDDGDLSVTINGVTKLFNPA